MYESAIFKYNIEYLTHTSKNEKGENLRALIFKSRQRFFFNEPLAGARGESVGIPLSSAKHLMNFT